MTIQDALKGLTNYPVSQKCLERISVKRGVSLSAIYTNETAGTQAYKLAEADVLIWVARAANISEGGVSITLTNIDRAALRQKALSVYNAFGDAEGTSEQPIKWGYKGSDL